MIKPVMLKTAATHALVALVMQGVGIGAAPLLGASLTTGAIVGGAAGVAFYLGREIAQHEYKGGAWDKDLPWHYGITQHWTLDSVLDLAGPVVAVTTLAIWL